MAMTPEAMTHLNFMKKQQWNVAYYAVLLLAAVFAVKKAFEPSLVVYERWLGTLLCVAVLMGAVLLTVLHPARHWQTSRTYWEGRNRLHAGPRVHGRACGERIL
jgi:protein-S-isoprenylcysteine O-methyltransferase Ste14